MIKRERTHDAYEHRHLKFVLVKSPSGAHHVIRYVREYPAKCKENRAHQVDGREKLLKLR